MVAALVATPPAENLPVGLQLGLEGAAELLQEDRGGCWAGQGALIVLGGMGWEKLRGAGFLVAPEPETSFPVLHLHPSTYVLNSDPLNCQSSTSNCQEQQDTSDPLLEHWAGCGTLE